MENEAVRQMLDRYNCTSSSDYRNALKEIIQELALFGLWRSKFFEAAAFYGGTALRILYKLNRFSEDLDFSLLSPTSDFQLKQYEEGVRRELEAFGFSLNVETKKKTVETAVQSAFIKGGTLEHLLKVGMPQSQSKHFHRDEIIKIKFEVDVDPPLRFKTESVPIFLPAPFSVRTYTMPDLFAGKLSALLFRKWQRRVKGRDWFDYLWYLSKGVAVNLDHFQARLEQIGEWKGDKALGLDDLKEMMHEKIDAIDIEMAKQDVVPFLRDPRVLDGWSQDLFHGSVESLVAY